MLGTVWDEFGSKDFMSEISLQNGLVNTSHIYASTTQVFYRLKAICLLIILLKSCLVSGKLTLESESKMKSFSPFTVMFES